MKRLICCLVLLFFTIAAFSQRLYFIYVQAEPAQPFFIKMGDKVSSSSSTGYLILPRLKDSSYQFSLGFPQNKWPEQRFKIDVRGKDRGFMLRNFGEKGWGLYDLQTLTILMAEPPADKAAAAGLKEVSAFTDVLAKAANDPSLREKPVLVSAAQPAAGNGDTQHSEPTVIRAVSRDEPEIKKEEMPLVSPEIISQTTEAGPLPEGEYKPSVVTRKSESSTTEGFGLSFIDEYADGTTDTIRIVIPNQRSLAAAITGVPPKEEKKFLDITTDDSNIPAGSAATSAPPARNYCADTASESDFRKLRRRMAGQNNDDDMVSEAVKYFRSKCFSVEQIKNLSSLFLFDSGKYKLFDAAYAHVSDVENFAGLQSGLSDKYYINRFQAMLRN